jgi:hypothetical protein
MRLKWLSIALLFPLTGCLDSGENFYIPADIGSIFGGGAAVVRPAPPANQAPATGAAKMLQDPEAVEDSTSDYVWADDEQSARNMCQRTAERNGWRLDDVQEAGGIALQTGKKRYTCYWTMFGEPR